MKRTLVLTILLAFSLNTLVAQWTTTGNDIYSSNSGNVGIGTTIPDSKLTVQGNGISLLNFANSVSIKANLLPTFANSSQFGLYANTNSNDGASIFLWNKDNTYSFKNGSVDLCSYGATGHGIRFTNYDPATSLWTNHMVLTKDGKLIIGNPTTLGWDGTTSPGNYRLYVEAGILTEKIKVALKTGSDWSDYVFKEGYRLMPLESVKKYVDSAFHLPGIPSAETLVNEGIDLGNMSARLLEKIEALYLYVIQLNQDKKELEKKINSLTHKLQQPESRETNDITSLQREIATLKEIIVNQKNK